MLELKTKTIRKWQIMIDDETFDFRTKELAVKTGKMIPKEKHPKLYEVEEIFELFPEKKLISKERFDRTILLMF